MCFDSGTTNTKVFLYSMDGKILQSASIKTGISFSGSLFVEQDCNDWVAAITKGISKLKQKSSVIGVSGSFQGGTFVLLDKNLLPLRPAITWLDNRAIHVAHDLVRNFGEDFFYKKTGYVPGGWSCVAILRWLKKNEPEIFRKTARISFVADYVNHFLTGNFVLDHTSAAITNLYNLKKRQWDSELLEIAGISNQMLPEIVEADTVTGNLKENVAGSTGLKSGIPVLAGGHDQYCASLGAGAAEKGKILVSCGTAWVLLVTTESIVFDDNRQLSPGPHLKQNIYGLMAAISNGGVVYEWGQKTFRQKFLPSDKPSGIIVIPEFNIGRGSICGLSLSTKASEIMQAIVESLCFQVRERLEKTEKILPEGEKINHIVMIGGAAKNSFLSQLLANITGKSVFVPEINEAAGAGAMKLFWRSFSLRESLSGNLFQADENLLQCYTEMYERYSELKKYA